MLSVADIMSTQLATLRETDTLAQARTLMAERDIRHLPIVSEDGEIVGLITQRDILAATDPALIGRAAVEREVSEGGLAVAEIMTRDVDTVDERDNIRSAALYMHRNKRGCMPVVTDGQLKGIVTDSDFVAVAIHLLEQMEEGEPEEEF